MVFADEIGPSNDARKKFRKTRSRPTDPLDKFHIHIRIPVYLYLCEFAHKIPIKRVVRDSSKCNTRRSCVFIVHRIASDIKCNLLMFNYKIIYPVNDNERLLIYSKKNALKTLSLRAFLRVFLLSYYILH